MKTIGLIGGMSWESTAAYYRIINEEVKNRLGGLHSAKILLYSLDFDEIEKCQKSGDWRKAGDILNTVALSLEKAGADVLAICTNTMHKVASEVCRNLTIPFLHIAEPTAKALTKAGHSKVILLGTRFTMEENFYIEVLNKHGLTVEVPNATERKEIHRIIYEELCVGSIKTTSEENIGKVITGLKRSGAKAVVLGCTELGMIVNNNHVEISVFDTTTLHARALVDFALTP